MSRVVRARGLALPLAPLPAGDVVAGSPATGSATVTTIGDVEVGVWRMTEGVARDVEVDEAFVVLSGSATIRFADGEELDVAAGDVVRLHDGERTEWTVHETVTKVYVA